MTMILIDMFFFEGMLKQIAEGLLVSISQQVLEKLFQEGVL